MTGHLRITIQSYSRVMIGMHVTGGLTHPYLQATLIEYNLDLVNSALLAVNSALAQGMDWHQLAQLIKSERKAGNPVRSPPYQCASADKACLHGNSSRGASHSSAIEMRAPSPALRLGAGRSADPQPAAGGQPRDAAAEQPAGRGGGR